MWPFSCPYSLCLCGVDSAALVVIAAVYAAMLPDFAARDFVAENALQPSYAAVRSTAADVKAAAAYTSAAVSLSAKCDSSGDHE